MSCERVQALDRKIDAHHVVVEHLENCADCTDDVICAEAKRLIVMADKADTDVERLFAN